MYDLNLVDRFYKIVVDSGVLISDNVKYDSIKDDLKNFFIKNYFISDDEIEIRNGFIMKSLFVFNKIFNNLNLSGDEKEFVLKKIDNYLYDFINYIYKNSDLVIANNKKTFFIKSMFGKYRNWRRLRHV